jgi:hypothetical protein
MAVQSYKNAELENVIFNVEDQDEWKQIAADLGLDKQMEFVQAAKSPLPYPTLTQSMKNIFQTLCPTKVDFKSYDKTPIPLEVLKELSFCIKEGYFSDIKIWSDDKAPDPIAVGTTTRFAATYYLTQAEKEESSWSNRKSTEYQFTSKEQAKDWCSTMGYFYNDCNQSSNEYLIARWADELRPMGELKALALDRLKDKYMSEWTKAVKEIQSKINTAEETLNLFLMGEISEWDLRKNL